MKFKSILISFLVLTLCGCSASWHVKRAMRLDPSLFTTKIDTVRDTIFIEITKVDTLFSYEYDTVEMYLDSVYVKYHYDTLEKKVFIEVDCPDSEIITETITKVETIVIKPSFWETIRYGVYALLIAVSLYTGYRVVSKFFF